MRGSVGATGLIAGRAVELAIAYPGTDQFL